MEGWVEGGGWKDGVTEGWMEGLREQLLEN